MRSTDDPTAAAMSEVRTENSCNAPKTTNAIHRAEIAPTPKKYPAAHGIPQDTTLEIPEVGLARKAGAVSDDLIALQECSRRCYDCFDSEGMRATVSTGLSHQALVSTN